MLHVDKLYLADRGQKYATEVSYGCKTKAKLTPGSSLLLIKISVNYFFLIELLKYMDEFCKQKSKLACSRVMTHFLKSNQQVYRYTCNIMTFKITFNIYHLFKMDEGFGSMK